MGWRFLQDFHIFAKGIPRSGVAFFGGVSYSCSRNPQGLGWHFSNSFLSLQDESLGVEYHFLKEFLVGLTLLLDPFEVVAKEFTEDG